MRKTWVRRFALGLLGGLAPVSLWAQGIGTVALSQIAAITAAKASFTAAQQKMDSNLVFAALAQRNAASVAAINGLIPSAGTDNLSGVTVDIAGSVSSSLTDAIVAAGGQVLSQAVAFGLVHASLPLSALEAIAGRDDVRNIQTAPGLVHSMASPVGRRTPARATSRLGVAFAGALTSQGYVSHGANTVISGTGYNGAGVTVGVLSDSASAGRIAVLVATGDLPANTTVLAGQTGPSNGTDEGTAMMEIIHDMAPGANLIFATADTGVASFASNIIALQQAGCKVIVDDVTYFNEGAFQDGPIAQAVNQVVAAGVTYFSSAGNSGNLTNGTSGTWEGDFVSGGAVGGAVAAAGETGLVHNFGTSGAPQTYDTLAATTSFLTLKWSDPLGASSNDYDLFVLDSTGTTLKGFSASAQTGTQDPYEAIEQGTNCGTASASGYCPAVGDRIVVVLFRGAARALHIDTNRGRLSLATSGATVGHNAGGSTVSTAATYWNSAHTGTRPFVGATNPTETFSSDGPRTVFYTPAGAAITPGNVVFSTGGGTTLQKPDLTAADGVSAKTPGFNPFYGTSAAAPHAAAIAALVLQAKPGYTQAQVVTAMTAGALDNMAPGVDRDSGYGIVMATLAVQYALNH